MQSSFFSTDSVPGGNGMMLVVSKSRLTEEENLEQLERDLITLTDTFQVRNIILDLKAVQYITSAAIAKLIGLHRRLARIDGRLVLCSLQPDVRSALAVSHLITYFSVADSPADAHSQLA